MTEKISSLRLKNLKINTYNEPIVYLRQDSYICRAEGFAAPARVQIKLGDKSIIATLNTIESDLLHHYEASLSSYAWNFLQANEGDEISITHPKHLNSLSYIRGKLYGHQLKETETKEIIEDLVAGQLSDIQVTMFLAATAENRLSKKEVFDLTNAMVKSGEQLTWPSDLVVDKHCVGGLPGNRTTLILVPIVAAFGLMIPKTSSRAITSPAGTADTMEVFAPVNLNPSFMRKIVEQENGCIVWGGSMSLSPADDLLVQIERAMDIDSEGQMVASILSKKIAAGSNHIIIDMPVGPSAKIRSLKRAQYLESYLQTVAKKFAVKIKCIFTDGSQPVGRGIGPALEAKDVFAVLSNDKNAPQDLRARALTLAGHVIEFSSKVKKGNGIKIATELLESGQALNKFQAICKAQGGFFDIPTAFYQCPVIAKKSGKITRIDNRYLARTAKLAGAPRSKAAGIELHVSLHSLVEKNQPLFTIYAESRGELNYALAYIDLGHDLFQIEEAI